MSHHLELALAGVSKVYQTRHGSVQALENINLEIARGELVCILGQSGCGKSTLLQIAAGLEKPTTGCVWARGQLVTGPNRQLGMVFQGSSLFPWLNVTDNVVFGLKLQGVTDWNTRAEEVLRLVGLHEFRHALPRQLSGGMAQRVALARTLVNGPDVMLLDEPLSALDAFTRMNMQAELVHIWRETGLTTLFVTHDIDEAIFLGDRVVILTSRPGHVKHIVDNPLPRPRDRNHPDFFEVRREIYHILGLQVSPLPGRSEKGQQS